MKPEVIDGFVLVGDEAWTTEQWAARERSNARRRDRSQQHREWEARNRERVRDYKRDWQARNRLKVGMKPRSRLVAVKYEVSSLHSMRCFGATKATGCVCHKVMVSKLAEAT
ncbi:MAG: hypothetical protein H0W41_02575 [Chloroflexi bacterium]|nr:hypothetical protein [Chloroflexota bacterium]